MKISAILEADATLEQVTQEAYRIFSNSGDRSDEPEKEGNGMTFAVRDIGEWEVSDDDRHDPDNAGDDFSDWDWKRPTKKTTEWVSGKLKELHQKYPKFKIQPSVEEKSWIHFKVTPK